MFFWYMDIMISTLQLLTTGIEVKTIMVEMLEIGTENIVTLNL